MSRRENLALLYWSACGHVRDMQRQRLPFDESDVRDLIHAARVFAKSGWPRLTNAARRNLPVVVLPVGPSGAA